MSIISIFYISLAFLLLYECTADSYNSYLYNSYLYSSYNTYYSDYFKSGYFKSGYNHFNSNYFNSGTNPFKYISIVNSNTLLISHSLYNDNSFVSSNSYNNNDLGSQTYLTRIHSYSYIQSQQHLYKSSYITQKPIFLPTISPTLLEGPTFKPSSDPDIPSIIFTTELTLSNVQTNYLDELAQQSVVIATANSMNISDNFVTFVSSSVLQNRKILDIQLLSFNLIATTKTSIPLQGKYSVFINNPSSLFTTLSNTMTDAVSNGVFTNYLVAASLKLNSTVTASASVSGITIIQLNVSNYNTLTPSSSPTTTSPSSSPTTTSPSSSPTKPNIKGTFSGSQTDYYYIILYTLVSFVSFYTLFYVIHKSYTYYKLTKIRLRRYMPKMIIRRLGQQHNRDTTNAENIELLIVNNE